MKGKSDPQGNVDLPKESPPHSKGRGVSADSREGPQASDRTACPDCGKDLGWLIDHPTARQGAIERHQNRYCEARGLPAAPPMDPRTMGRSARRVGA